MGRFRPRHEPWEEKLAIFMGCNALVQLLLDIIFESLHLIPTRINHLSLTFLNAFISYKTLSAIKKNRFSFMHEDCQILWVMEVCLIFGDVWYAIFDDFSIKFIYIRLMFICFSTMNLIGVTWIMVKYQLWSISYKGHGPPGPRNSLQRLQKSFSVLGDMDEKDAEIVAGHHISDPIPAEELNDDDLMDDTESVNAAEEARDAMQMEIIKKNLELEKINSMYMNRKATPESKKLCDESCTELTEIESRGLSSVTLLNESCEEKV